MSETNYRVCPKCLSTAIANGPIASVKKEYGQVSAEVYNKLILDAMSDEQIPKVPATLREDWWIRVTVDGRFEVEYRAACQDDGCDFDYRFDHEEKVLL